MATTRNADGSWNYSGPVLADAAAQAGVEQAERDVILANETTVGQQAEAALAELRIYRDRTTTTTAQDKAFMKLAARVLIGLIRLVLRRLDGTA